MKIDDSLRRERPKLKSDDRHTVFVSPKKKTKSATPPTFLAYRPAARRGPRSENACKTYIKMVKRLKTIDRHNTWATAEPKWPTGIYPERQRYQKACVLLAKIDLERPKFKSDQTAWWWATFLRSKKWFSKIATPPRRFDRKWEATDPRAKPWPRIARFAQKCKSVKTASYMRRFFFVVPGRAAKK